MKYSIIVPIFNSEKYLYRCIDSVISQSYTNWELVLIDDGSTDSSREICDTYAVTYPLQVKVIHQENAGVLKARRVGISVSKGDYLCFLDSDDFYDRNLLERVTSYLALYDPDVLVFGFRIVTERGDILETKTPNKTPTLYTGDKMKEIHEKIVTGNLSNLWNQIVRKSCVDFESDYSKYYWVYKGEDLLQNLAFIERADSVLLVPDCMYSYFINQEGLTRRKITSSYIQSHLKVQETLLEYCEKWEIDSYQTKQLFIYVYIRCLKALYRDPYSHTQYSRKEREDLLNILSTGQAYDYLLMIKIPMYHKCSTCLRLLRRRHLRLLSGVLYFLHFLLMIRNALRYVQKIDKWSR